MGKAPCGSGRGGVRGRGLARGAVRRFAVRRAGGGAGGGKERCVGQGVRAVTRVLRLGSGRRTAGTRREVSESGRRGGGVEEEFRDGAGSDGQAGPRGCGREERDLRDLTVAEGGAPGPHHRRGPRSFL